MASKSLKDCTAATPSVNTAIDGDASALFRIQ
jgi:hypothetical protein